MRFLLVILCLGFISAVYADIYKCVNPNGAVFFKDTPCKIRDFQYQYNYLEEPVTQQDVRSLQRQYKRSQSDKAKAKKGTQRSQARAKKQEELEQKRRLRLQANCEKVQQQIAQLNQRLKHGYTAKQGQSIARKLAECNLKRQKYCK